MKKLIAVFLIIVISMSALLVPVAGVAADIADYKTQAVTKFRDVKTSDWYAEAVGKLNALGIIDGFAGKFEPAGNVTRAQFVKMLVQAMEYKKVDSISFTDIKPFPTSTPHWAAVYIETALRNGVIVKDKTGENFFPDVPLKRLDMAVMMARALELEPSDGENPFVDMPEANGYAVKLYEEYLIRGFLEDGARLYRPQGLTTRAEAATIVSRMLDYKTDPEGYVASMAKQEQIGMPLEIYDRLMADTKNLDGRTMEQANKELRNNEATAYYAKLYNLTPKELVEHVVKLAYDYIMADWNIDYRTVESTYRDKVKDIIPYDHYNQDLTRTIQYYNDNKVMHETIFHTNSDLVYGQRGTFHIRGNVIYRISEPTSLNYLQRLKERDNGELLSLGQWYSEDIEVEIAGDPGSRDTQMPLRVYRVKIFNHPKPIDQ